MTQQLWLKWFGIGCILLSLGVGTNILYKRAIHESHVHPVQIASYYDTIRDLANSAANDTPTLLSRLKQENTLTTLFVKESTIQNYIDDGKITLLKGAQIENNLRIGRTYRTLINHLKKKGGIRSNKLYLVVDEHDTYEHIKNTLVLTLSPKGVKERGWNILEVTSNLDTIRSIGIGFSKKNIQKLQGYGYNVIPELRYQTHTTEDLLQYKFQRLSKLNDIKTISFTGHTILGYPNLTETLIKELQNYTIVMPERNRPSGLVAIAKILPNAMLRTYISPAQPLSKAQFPEINRAIQDRQNTIIVLNINTNNVHPSQLLDTTSTLLKQLITQVQGEGIVISSTSEAKNNLNTSISYQETLALSVGLLVWFLILWNQIFLLKLRSLLLISGIFMATFVLFLTGNAIDIWERIMMFASVCIFPILALIHLFPNTFPKEHATLYLKLKKTFLYTLQLFSLTLVGAIYIVGFTYNIYFLKGIHHFYGVKLSLLIPLLCITLFYFIGSKRLHTMYYIFRRVIQTPVNTITLVSLSSIFIIIGLYALRNSIDQFQYIDQLMAASIDNITFIRPRIKEFLIGFPCLIIGYMFCDTLFSRKWIWFFNGIGSIALVSILHSFCFSYTPLIITGYRTCISLAFGIAAAAIYIGIVYILRTIIKHVSHKKLPFIHS